MIYGYARCSTNEKEQDINRQKRELKELGATDETIYFEYESGTKVDRPEFNKLLNIVQKGDTVVTTEVSRLTRSTKQLCDIIQLISDKGLKLVIKGSVTIDCSNGEIDPMTKSFLQMAGVFAELERNLISARVKSGLDNARAKGKVIGRPKTTEKTIPDVFKKHYYLYKEKKLNKKELSKVCGLSYPTTLKYIALTEK